MESPVKHRGGNKHYWAQVNCNESNCRAFFALRTPNRQILAGGGARPRSIPAYHYQIGREQIAAEKQYGKQCWFIRELILR
jgi:hypothetical protein